MNTSPIRGVLPMRLRKLPIDDHIIGDSRHKIK